MKNHEDYEKYSMLRDQMKLYNTYKSLQINCFSCSKFSHIHDKCPLVHFIPDKTFIIKRFLHCNNQKRNSGFKRKMKRTLNALLDNNLILNDILRLDSALFLESDENYDSDDLAKDHLTPFFPEPNTTMKINTENEGEMEENKRNIQYPNLKRESLIKSNIKPPKSKSTSEILELESDSKPKENHLKRQLSKEKLNLEKNFAVKFMDENYEEIRPLSCEKGNNHKFFMNEEIRPNIKRKSSLMLHSKLSRQISFNKKTTWSTKSIEKEDDRNHERESRNPHIPMFHDDFDIYKEWNLYFTEGNIANIIKKLRPKENSPSPSLRKKIEKKIRLSKFQVGSGRSVKLPTVKDSIPTLGEIK